MPGQCASECLEAADVGLQDIEGFDGLENIAVVLGRRLIAVIPADQHLYERKQEFEILRGWLKAEGIDAIVAGFCPYLEIRAVQQACELFVTSAQVKDECPGIVFL